MSMFNYPGLGLLPLVPVPTQAPLDETLSFKTDIMTSYNGREGTPLALRTKPRQRIETRPVTRRPVTQDTFNTVRGNLARRWLVPLWQLARPVGSVASGSDVIACDTRYSDFRVGQAVLLSSSCGSPFVSLVEAKTNDSLTLANATTEFLRGVVAVPLLVGRLVGQSSKSTDGYETDWRLNYEVDDNLALVPAAPAQYFGEDIYLEPTLFSGSELEETELMGAEVFDGETGAVRSLPTWTLPRNTRPFRLLAETDAEAWALRQFAYRRMGRYRRFWLPTFEDDVRLAQTGNLAATVTVHADSRTPFSADRINLAFGLADGTWLPRRVTNDEAAGAGLRTLTLNTALGINASQVRAISYLGYRRLNSDEVQLTWLGNGRCELSAQVLELSP